jgi:3-oxoadipate enol-lactonase
MRLARTEDGRDDAPVLALVGGLGTTTAVWDRQVEPFSSHFRIVRFDLPGHGASPVPNGPVTIAEIGRSVLASLDVEQVSFCGISLGGMVGMWLAAEAPGRIARIVLACTGASLGTPESYAERAALVRAEGTQVTVDGARERWFTLPFRDSPPARRILDDLRGISAEGYAACCEAVGAFDFQRRLGEVAAPALVVYGSEDPVTPPEVVETLATGLPTVDVVRIEAAAHLANVEQPDAFASAVLRFVDERIAA